MVDSELIDARQIEERYGIKRATLRRRVLYCTFPKPEAFVPQARADGKGGARKAVWRRATVEKALAREPLRPGKWVKARRVPRKKSVS